MTPFAFKDRVEETISTTRSFIGTYLISVAAKSESSCCASTAHPTLVPEIVRLESIRLLHAAAVNILIQERVGRLLLRLESVVIVARIHEWIA